jgi:hypothetical protein
VVKITYYGERIQEHFWWYIGLSYESESYAGSQFSSNWKVQWFAISMFAFPLVLMYFGLKKRYSFDVGVIVFALFFGWLTLPPLISPMSMGAGWDAITSEAQIGSHVATMVLITYGVARLYLRGTIADLEADRIPPPKIEEQSEVMRRRTLLILALLSFVLPFAVDYRIHHLPEHTMAELSMVYYWFGNIAKSHLGLYLLFLPIIYLPLLMMWLGMNRPGLFTNGVRLFTIYWIWHLLFFLKPSYIAEEGWSEKIVAPTVGIVFFPTVLLLYIISFSFKSPRINRFLLESGLKGVKAKPKAFLKKCPKCGTEIPIASEECQHCGAKQPDTIES